MTNKLLLAFPEMITILNGIQSRASKMDYFMKFKTSQAIIRVNGVFITINTFFLTHWRQLGFDVLCLMLCNIDMKFISFMYIAQLNSVWPVSKMLIIMYIYI